MWNLIPNWENLITNWKKNKVNPRSAIAFGAIGLIAIGGGLLVRKLLDKLIRKYYNYPPGTNGYPLIGSLFKLSDPIFHDYLRNSFGVVSMINIGFNKCIIINDLKLTKKLFNDDAFTNHNMHLFDKPTFMEINGEMMLFRRKLIQNTFLSLINSNYLNTIGLNLIQNNLIPQIEKHLR